MPISLFLMVQYFPLNAVVPPAAENTITEGALVGAFSVSAVKQVHFSQGNLQYQASTNTWRFASQQYSYIGNAVGNTTAYEERAQQEAWIDLFGFGTSGWNSGAAIYQPWEIRPDNTTYYIGDDPSIGLTGNYARADWGVNNKISNGGNETGIWRTLTFAEWTYLLESRADKYALATIESVMGLLLLPDAFTLPAGCTYTAGVADGYNTNVYTLSQWMMMQDAGCVFLPTAGYRSNLSVTNVGTQGRYWSTDVRGDTYSQCVYILVSGVNLTYCNRSNGLSVRLVKDISH